MTRVERPTRPSRRDGEEEETGEERDLPSGVDEDEDLDDGSERIDESESEAAPAAID